MVPETRGPHGDLARRHPSPIRRLRSPGIPQSAAAPPTGSRRADGRRSAPSRALRARPQLPTSEALLEAGLARRPAIRSSTCSTTCTTGLSARTTSVLLIVAVASASASFTPVGLDRETSPGGILSFWSQGAQSSFFGREEALVVCPRNDLAVARTSPNGSSNGDSGPNRRNASQIKRQLVQGTHH